MSPGPIAILVLAGGNITDAQIKSWWRWITIHGKATYCPLPRGALPGHTSSPVDPTVDPRPHSAATGVSGMAENW
jgi:hypothetical protein